MARHLRTSTVRQRQASKIRRRHTGFQNASFARSKRNSLAAVAYHLAFILPAGPPDIEHGETHHDNEEESCGTQRRCSGSVCNGGVAFSTSNTHMSRSSGLSIDEKRRL